jgi:hypothetical protein
MVSPTKQPLSNPDYSAVPSASPDPNMSPNLGGNPRPSSAYLSPELSETAMMRRQSDLFPAPSLMSRDSTHESLLGAHNLPGSRGSWGSGVGLAGAAGGIAGAEAVGHVPVEW